MSFLSRFFFVLLMLAAPAAAQPPGGMTAIIGADVLPMTRENRLRDQTVLISGDRIVKVGPRRSVRIPAGARRIDAKGMILMPGLVDMHVHLAPVPGADGDAAQRALAVMLAHGVTTVRGMAGSPANLAVRDAIEQGRLAGPRFYVAAPGINLQNTASADEAREKVRQAKAAGYDLIKSHHIVDVSVWEALQDEARKLGLPTAGHVANQVGLSRAMAAGQQIEHLDGFLLELLPDGSALKGMDFAQIPPPPVMQAAAEASDARIAALAAQAASARSYHVPTLALFERFADIDRPAEEMLTHPDMRYVPDAALQQWAAQRRQMQQAGFTSADGARFREVRRRIVAALHRAGAPLMAGSDTAQSFHIWGPGLIQEVQALGAAGLSPIEALRSATIVPRDYLRSLPNGGSSLGWKADFGTVTEGARADLILLSEDPSTSLAAMGRPQTVIAGGRSYDRAALDAMLEKAAADAKAPPATQTAAAPARQVYVMRHLQAAEGADPSLTAAGAEQADRLAQWLQHADIKAIFVTDTNRARQTAAKVAEKTGIQATVYNPGAPDQLVQAAASASGNVLIIGHSNTVPDIVARLGGTPPGPLGAADFGTLWRVDSGSKVTRSFALAGSPPVALGPCAGTQLHPSARCGSIKVAEDRRKPSGRQIDIHFAVIPAAETATDAPVVMLPGGPGLGGVQSGQGIEQMFGPAHRNRDILLIDQRGTGKSNGLFCPAAPQGPDPLTQLRSTTAEEMKACRDALAAKADLSLYHTREAVLDMEEVRAALGYPQLDLFAMSYGTRPALDYLRLFADRVGQTVVRAAAPPAMTMPLWGPRDTQRAFDTIAATCAAQSDCAARHPDLIGDLKAIMARLDRGPMPVTFTNPATGQQVTGQFTRDALSSVLFFLLYIPEYLVQLPPLLDAAAKGDPSGLITAAAPFVLGVNDQLAWGMYRSVICDEDVRRIDARTIEAATRGTFMGAESVTSDIEACSVWPRATIPADYLAPLRSDKEVFIISGEFDPVAGKIWGDTIASTLPNSVHVDVAGASHMPPLPGCTAGLVAKFLDGAPLKSLDMSCLGESKRPRLHVAAPGA